MQTEYIAPIEFEAFLDQQSGERGIASFIQQRPQILYWALCGRSGHCRFVFHEFPLGNSFVADFVVLNSYSGVWEVKFVEFEPVDVPIFTKADVPAKRLAGAVKQADDWADYFEKNKNEVRRDLVRWAKSKDIPGYSDGDRPSNFSGHHLADPTTNLFDSHHIFIGRRANTSPEHHSRKGRLSQRHNVEVATYDRLLDLAKERYANPELWKIDGSLSLKKLLSTG